MRFASKRNEVTLEAGEVVKRYKDLEGLRREAWALEYLSNLGLAVPALLAVDEDSLRMEYIPGETYEALTESMTVEKAAALARWLADYQRMTGLLRGDVNLRNFLWTGQACVGVDFEDPPLAGQGETDMGKILAYAVTYGPAFTVEKEQCANLLLAAFSKTGGEREKIREAYLKEIGEMNHRRSGKCVEIAVASLFFDGLK